MVVSEFSSNGTFESSITDNEKLPISGWSPFFALIFNLTRCRVV